MRSIGPKIRIARWVGMATRGAPPGPAGAGSHHDAGVLATIEQLAGMKMRRGAAKTGLVTEIGGGGAAIAERRGGGKRSSPLKGVYAKIPC